MLRTVKLYYKESTMTIKIRNKIIYDPLLVYLHRIVSQKIIP